MANCNHVFCQWNYHTPANHFRESPAHRPRGNLFFFSAHLCDLWYGSPGKCRLGSAHATCSRRHYSRFSRRDFNWCKWDYRAFVAICRPHHYRAYYCVNWFILIQIWCTGSRATLAHRRLNHFSDYPFQSISSA